VWFGYNPKQTETHAYPGDKRQANMAALKSLKVLTTGTTQLLTLLTKFLRIVLFTQILVKKIHN
jgi:hypothetical protein